MSQKRITGYTAERIQKIEDELVSGGGLDRDGNLILNLKNGRTLNLGKVGAVDKGGDVDLSKVRPPEELSYIQDPVKDPLRFAPIYYCNESYMPPQLRLVLVEEDEIPDAFRVSTYDSEYDLWTEEEKEAGRLEDEDELYEWLSVLGLDSNTGAPSTRLWTATIIGCKKVEAGALGILMSKGDPLVIEEADSGVCSISWVEFNGYGSPNLRIYNPDKDVSIRVVRRDVYPAYGTYDMKSDAEIAKKWLGL